MAASWPQHQQAQATSGENSGEAPGSSNRAEADRRNSVAAAASARRIAVGQQGMHHHRQEGSIERCVGISNGADYWRWYGMRRGRRRNDDIQSPPLTAGVRYRQQLRPAQNRGANIIDASVAAYPPQMPDRSDAKGDTSQAHSCQRHLL